MVIWLAAATLPASVGNSPQEGLGVAVKACEAWILNPATWADQIDQFPNNAGLTGRLEPQSNLPDIVLPPPHLRQAMHSWRVPVGAGGYFVTVSDILPFCHIAGGGPDDFEPGAEAELQSIVNSNRWSKIKDLRQGDMLSTEFMNTSDKNLTMIVSRAASARQRTDRVQVLATAQYEVGQQ